MAAESPKLYNWNDLTKDSPRKSELTGFICTRLNVVFDLEEGVGRWQRRDLARSR